MATYAFGGLTEGWQVLGLDWDTGNTVDQPIFGNANFGNGAHAILQCLENQDLLFNATCGPFRAHYRLGRES